MISGGEANATPCTGGERKRSTPTEKNVASSHKHSRKIIFRIIRGESSRFVLDFKRKKF